MKYPGSMVRRSVLVFIVTLVSTLPGNCGITKAADNGSQRVILSARMENGSLIYRLNGKRVEDSKDNSLLTNLTKIVKVEGTTVPVFIIIDVRAPFTEAGKLETALDKAGFTRCRLFVSSFTNGSMNEIHWDASAVPIPK